MPSSARTAPGRPRCSTSSPASSRRRPGSIHLGDRDITGLSAEQIVHLGVARSFQITSLFDQMSCVDHVELALASPTGLGYRFWRSHQQMRRFRPRAMDLLGQVGLGDRAGLLAGSLAYGQKRALELALALALDPRLLLLDEPTAGMGVEDVDRTIALVQRVSAGRTVVLVDHNMHVVGSLADRVTVLQSGQRPRRGPVRRGAPGRARHHGLPRPGERGRPWVSTRPGSRCAACPPGTARRRRCATST